MATIFLALVDRKQPRVLAQHGVRHDAIMARLNV